MLIISWQTAQTALSPQGDGVESSEYTRSDQSFLFFSAFRRMAYDVSVAPLVLT